MVATKTEYGNWYSLEGVLADVMAELKGKSRDEVVAVNFSDSTTCVAVCVHKT